MEGEPERWTPLAETLLFLSARADHVARVIEPALTAGTWVISDRFADSTFVYQGIAAGSAWISCAACSMTALGDFHPDLTLVLDVNPREGLARAGARAGAENRFERFDEAFHARLREGFRAIAAQEPQRCALIDASAKVDAVAAEVWRVVERTVAAMKPARCAAEAEEPDRIEGQAHPRETYDLIGHDEALARAARAIRSGRAAAGMADLRPAGHRQGDARLSHRALCASLWRNFRWAN